MSIYSWPLAVAMIALAFAPPPIAEMAAPLSFGDSRKKKEDERFVGGKGGQNETHTVQRGGLKKV